MLQKLLLHFWKLLLSVFLWLTTVLLSADLIWYFFHLSWKNRCKNQILPWKTDNLNAYTSTCILMVGSWRCLEVFPQCYPALSMRFKWQHSLLWQYTLLNYIMCCTKKGLFYFGNRSVRDTNRSFSSFCSFCLNLVLSSIAIPSTYQHLCIASFLDYIV